MFYTAILFSAGFNDKLKQIQNPDQYSETTVSGSGLTKKGYYLFRLSNNDGSFIHEGIQCMDWITTDLVITLSQKKYHVFILYK